MRNFYQYYLEIKNRALLLFTAWSTTILVSYIYKETILFIMIKPSLGSNINNTVYFIFTNVTELFYVYFQIVTFLGSHVIILYLFYHLVLFLSLGLYKFEYRNLMFLFKASLFFFIISIIFFNKILLPISWQFFLSFQSFNLIKSIDLYFESKLNEYLIFYIASYFICVCYCQTFVLMVSFFKYIKTDLEKVKQYRRVFYFSFLVLSTLLTPPDIVSQLFLSGNIIIVYELLLWILLYKAAGKKLKNQPVLKHKHTNKT